MKLRASALIVAIILILLAFNPLNASAATTLAVLKEVNGEVVLIKGGGKQEFVAFNGMQIQQGDTIRTGKASSVKIDFGEDQATLGEYGKVTLAEYSSTDSESEFTILSTYSGKNVTVKQESGGLWSKVKRTFGAGNSHKVETSTAIMGVRGTAFLTSMDRNNNESVSVLDGVVGVERARGTKFSGVNEPRVTPSLELTLSGQAPLESQSINYQELFNKVDAVLATEIVVDVVEIAEERAAEAEREADDLERTKDKEQAKKALELAARAELMANISEQAVRGASQSNKSSEVNSKLQQRQQSLAQLQTRAQDTKSKTQETKQRVELLATQAGLTQQEQRQVTEAITKQIETVQSQPVSTTPSFSGGGGGESSIVRVTGVSLNRQTVTLTTGGTIQLNATVNPTNATNKSVNWTSSDINVATVDQTGKVEAKSNGIAVIYARTVDGDFYANAYIYVGTGTISGYVGEICAVECFDPAPIEGATVEAYSGSNIFTATTDVNGHFTIEVPANLSLNVRAIFESQYNGDGVVTVNYSSSISVGPGEEIDNIMLIYDPSNSPCCEESGMLNLLFYIDSEGNLVVRGLADSLSADYQVYVNEEHELSNNQYNVTFVDDIYFEITILKNIFNFNDIDYIEILEIDTNRYESIVFDNLLEISDFANVTNSIDYTNGLLLNNQTFTMDGEITFTFSTPIMLNHFFTKYDGNIQSITFYNGEDEIASFEENTTGVHYPWGSPYMNKIKIVTNGPVNVDFMGVYGWLSQG